MELTAPFPQSVGAVRPWRPGFEALTAPLPALEGLRRRTFCRALMLSFGRLLEVRGREHLAGLGEPAIFALNHGGSFESVLVPAALIYLRGGRPLHFLCDWMYLHVPLLGWMVRQCEPIPVYGKPARFRLREGFRRERRRTPVAELCLARLRAGGSVGIFPEGTRNPDPRALLRGRAGLGELVLRSDAMVVPIGIRYPAAARLGRPPRIGRLVVAIGRPLDFAAERAALAAAGDPDRLRRASGRAIVDRVMTAVGALAGKSYGK